MTDKLSTPADDRDRLAEALRLNWEHARHVELLRMQVALFYIPLTLGTGYAAFTQGSTFARILAVALGLAVTAFCSVVTDKLNTEFSNQIKKADRCAQALLMGDGTLHGYIGFPKREYVHGVRISVRDSFWWLYSLFAIAWALVWLGLAGGLI